MLKVKAVMLNVYFKLLVNISLNPSNKIMWNAVQFICDFLTHIYSIIFGLVL
jgi:hypothetical protein